MGAWSFWKGKSRDEGLWDKTKNNQSTKSKQHNNLKYSCLVDWFSASPKWGSLERELATLLILAREVTWWSLVFQARGHTLGWLEQSDSRVESTSQSLKNQVESTSHTWSLWVVLALVLRSGCVCLLVMFIFSYVLIANWILGKEFFIWWRTMQVKFFEFHPFGTPFRFSMLHSLIPFMQNPTVK